jgi:uncharacterized DUF497 family protein
VEITFDPAKRARVLAERGLDFAKAGEVFSGLIVTIEDNRFDSPEVRFQTAGEFHGRLVVVVWTATEAGRRIISMRHAHEREARKWRERMG